MARKPQGRTAKPTTGKTPARPRLTHLDASGKARMVDVSDKDITARVATARGSIHMAPATLALIRAGGFKKGDVMSIARLAGIMGAKRTSDLIPLCHPLALNSVAVEIEVSPNGKGLDITATCKIVAKTGIEMEALTAVSVAALTIYDMCKAVDRGMVIGDIRLTHKSGGQSGSFTAR